MHSTIEQKQASNPSYSVWLSANAGTGKTKVLVDRLLRLIIEGNDPRKIICITFTQAAASEMQSRVVDKCSKWMLLDDLELKEKYSEITEENLNIDIEKLRAAKTIFASIMDNPSQLRIQTIHSTCQAILSQFPIEADAPPFFEVIDEITRDEIFEECWLKIKNQCYLGKKQNPELAEALTFLISKTKENNLKKNLKDVFGKKEKLLEIIETAGGVENYYEALLDNLNLEFKTEEEFIYNFRESNLELINKSLKLPLRSDETLNMFNGFISGNISFLSLEHLLLTGEEKPKLSKGHVYIHIGKIKDSLKKEEAMELATKLVNNYHQAYTNLKELNSLKITKAFLTLFSEILTEFENKKSKQGYLDYNDLITKTSQLLSDEGLRDWILYKLDGGIQHILLDEAQDTNKEQWNIINSLTENYFSSVIEDENKRDQKTLFVVGDEKQSIYSFQGADVEVFEDKKVSYLNISDKNPSVDFRKVDLQTSFRSNKSILQLVDKVAENPKVRSSITNTESNILHRDNEADFGRVKLYPLVDITDKPKKAKSKEISWKLPIEVEADDEVSKNKLLAKKITREIKSLLNQNIKIIEGGEERSLNPKDFLVLVKTRNKFFNNLIEELQNNKIPVSGLDRLKLKDEIIIKDLLAVAKFKLLPDDDLNLAELLKSPIFGLNDDDLLEICSKREGKSVYDSLREKSEKNNKFSEVYEILNEILNNAKLEGTSEFFYSLVERLNFREKIIVEEGININEVLDEFLQLATDFEELHNENLQKFIIWFENNDYEIKRNLEEADNQVRIMTIHGSKGLEAPFVFIADTTSKSKEKYDFAKSEEFFVYAANKDNAGEFFKTIKSNERIKIDNEYYRLLYVALTRARNELHIFGINNHNAKNPDNWYNIIKSALSELPSTTNEKSEVVFEKEVEDIASDSKVSNDNQVKQGSFDLINKEEAIPEYFRQKFVASEEIEYLTPNELSSSEYKNPTPKAEASETTSSTNNSDEVLRGLIIHRLLEKLPNYKENDFDLVAKKVLKEFPSIEKEEYEALYKEAYEVLSDDTLKFVFESENYNEIAISGYISDKKFVNGIIDKLVLKDDELWIIDFKTTQNLNGGEKQKAQRYTGQMNAYEELLKKIYTNKKIIKAILFTYSKKLITL